jgi:hypothetical protein
MSLGSHFHEYQILILYFGDVPDVYACINYMR